MGLTSALFTGLSGLNSNQFRIDVIGDNIANANTTGFKGSRSMFQTQFAQMFSLGTPPGNAQGGTNGIEVGLGSAIGATQRNMQQGSTETTGLSSDLAIDGNGFFVVRSADNRQAFTRDGSFLLNADNYLVTADGFYLQGYGVDSNFNIIPGVLTDIKVPLGEMSAASATDLVTFRGNLPGSDVTAATTGSIYQSQQLVEDAVGTVADGDSLLTSLRAASDPTALMLSNGDVISLNSITKGPASGGRVVPDAQFIVGTTGTTVTDFCNWLNTTLGINTAAPTGSPGVSISGGQITIAGNAGTQNALNIASANISSDGAVTNPFVFGKTQDADGGSIYTMLEAVDSLGTKLQVGVTMVFEGSVSGQNTWRFYAESPDDTSGARTVGTGTVTFDSQGRLVNSTGNSVTIDRDNTGAADPLAFTLDFSAVGGLGGEFSLVQAGHNGFEPGELTGFSVGADGTVIGTFRNGLSRTLGQVALANFSNPAGLTRETNNLFRAGPNSGEPMVAAAGAMGAGRIMSGTLELSNVDLSREFIGLINASTGFSAAGKVITTSDELLNDLLMLTR